MSNEIMVLSTPLIVIYGAYLIIAALYGFDYTKRNEDCFAPLTPKRIYNKFEVNWLGAIIFYLACIIVNPVWMIYSWFYVLFTIGRK